MIEAIGGNKMAEDRILYFNLNNEGDNATVRLLHKSVSSIKSAMLHTLDIDGKRKAIKCLGEGCPICSQKGEEPFKRVFIHLYDYTDNTEKVWSRTDKILPQFDEIEKNWGDLSDCVVNIKRLQKEFPKYDVTTVNPKQFADVNPELIDKDVSYRFYMTRSAEDINQYFATGIMPPKNKQAYTPKEEVNTPPTNKVVANTNQNSINTTNSAVNTPPVCDITMDDDDDPFAVPFSISPRKV
jgi:hypothetical protein